MNAQLLELRERNRAAMERVRRMGATHTADQLLRKPDPARWCAAECIGHLNITASKMHPLIKGELGTVPNAPPGATYKRDFVGRLLYWSLRPGSSFNMRTPDSFIPSGITTPGDVLTRFGEWQEELDTLLLLADGKDLNAVKVRSPFNEKARYNLFSALSIVVVHVERHLLQAERALEG